MITKSRQTRLARIKKHIKKSVRGTSDRPRLTVYRSLRHLYAQVVDDSSRKTITSVSTMSKDVREQVTGMKNKMEIAKLIGQTVAKKALEQNVREVVFDRSGYLYHGVVKALADGAREAGLKL